MIFFISGSRKLILNIFESGENNIEHIVWDLILIVSLNWKISIFLQICRASTTLKSEGEVTSLSGADKEK
jgi:hypothetical protein